MKPEDEKQPWRDRFNYDPKTGVFTFKSGYFPSRIGKVAGRVNKAAGYRYLSLDGKERLAHRVAWLFMTGEWPTDEVDHIDRDRANCRWSNLRAASRSDNMANSRRPNTSGLRGAFVRRDGKFFSQVVKHGKLTYLGTFGTAEAAHAAYCTAAQHIHGEFASNGSAK